MQRVEVPASRRRRAEQSNTEEAYVSEACTQEAYVRSAYIRRKAQGRHLLSRGQGRGLRVLARRPTEPINPKAEPGHCQPSMGERGALEDFEVQGRKGRHSPPVQSHRDTETSHKSQITSHRDTRLRCHQTCRAKSHKVLLPNESVTYRDWRLPSLEIVSGMVHVSRTGSGLYEYGLVSLHPNASSPEFSFMVVESSPPHGLTTGNDLSGAAGALFHLKTTF